MRNEHGFTLLEVILAFGIAAIIITATFTALMGFTRARAAVVDYSTPYAVGPQILDVIEADLRNAYFYDFKDNDGFWGHDDEINGREADGISFLTTSLGRTGEQKLLSTRTIGQEKEPGRRRSPTNEVQYVCRQSKKDRDHMELWRRESFYVDDQVHDGGIYRLLHDQVFDFKLEYIARETRNTADLSGASQKSLEEMRQDGWSSIENGGLPRAVLISISIFVRKAEEVWAGEPQAFVFRRWVPLPQVHMSTESEFEIASWNGDIKEVPRGPGGAGARNKLGQAGQPGQPGAPQPFQPGGAAPGAPPAGFNPFLSLLQNRAPSPVGGGAFADLFKPK